MEFIETYREIEGSIKIRIKHLVKQIAQQMLADLYPVYIESVKVLVNELNELNSIVVVRMKELIPELRRFN